MLINSNTIPVERKITTLALKKTHIDSMETDDNKKHNNDSKTVCKYRSDRALLKSNMQILYIPHKTNLPAKMVSCGWRAVEKSLGFVKAGAF